ncbi:hypothetical protein [Streptomyces sp. PTY087I2]|uniref:hypothetical protein n=1 Tax=Streptomyces sp. PTY087I2 TaxID=1819298 RepID=UPI00080B0845|nr:hypothetical protein [Streptomyces sp. PTY087I2]OCC08574.1 hypothetical protein A3Q37_05614 [Streptomyces sp. PTY087I2]
MDAVQVHVEDRETWLTAKLLVPRQFARSASCAAGTASVVVLVAVENPGQPEKGTNTQTDHFRRSRTQA